MIIKDRVRGFEGSRSKGLNALHSLFIVIVALFVLCSIDFVIAKGPKVDRGRDFNPSEPGAIGDETPGSGRFGGGANYIDIDSSGVMTLHGTAKRYLFVRPRQDIAHQIAQAKPTEVQVGIFFGYSMPVYNNDDEELFFRDKVPYFWDGESDFTFIVHAFISNTEDVGDNFKFQLDWEHYPHGEPAPATSNTVTTEQAVLTGRNAQYDCYHLEFTIDYDIDGAGNEVISGSHWAGRLRRIDATNPDVDNEVVASDWVLKYQLDKFAGTW